MTVTFAAGAFASRTVNVPLLPSLIVSAEVEMTRFGVSLSMALTTTLYVGRPGEETAMVAVLLAKSASVVAVNVTSCGVA